MLGLPAFAESHGRKPMDEGERVTRRSLGEGGYASAGFAVGAYVRSRKLQPKRREDATRA